MQPFPLTLPCRNTLGHTLSSLLDCCLVFTAGLILTYPGAFRGVCTTEIGEATRRRSSFMQRGVRICGFCCDAVESCRVWVDDIDKVTGSKPDFPLFCDPDQKAAKEMGVLMNDNVKDSTGNGGDRRRSTVIPTTYVLHPDRTIAALLMYPVSSGRSFDELIRLVDSLQLEINMKVDTPADWKAGGDVLVSHDLTDEEAEQLFGRDGFQIAVLPSEEEREKKGGESTEEGPKSSATSRIDRHYVRWTTDPSWVPLRGSEKRSADDAFLSSSSTSSTPNAR